MNEYVPTSKFTANQSTVFEHIQGGPQAALPPKPHGRPPIPGKSGASIIQD